MVDSAARGSREVEVQIFVVGDIIVRAFIFHIATILCLLGRISREKEKTDLKSVTRYLICETTAKGKRSLHLAPRLSPSTSTRSGLG